MATLRKVITPILMLPILNLSASAQQIVENPAKPLNPNAGRVITLSEVLRITDEGTDQYYFEYPERLHIAPDGSIFVLDRD
jgi:hypothetical protein